MRGIETSVSKIRGKVLEEVARAAYESEMLHRLLKLFLFQYHLQTNQGTGKAFGENAP